MPVNNVYQSANSSDPIQVRKRPAMWAETIKAQPTKYSSVIVPPAPKLDFSSITPAPETTKPASINQPVQTPIPSFASISKPTPAINPVSPMKPEAQAVQQQAQAITTQWLPSTGIDDTLSIDDKMNKIWTLTDKELQQVQEAKDNWFSEDEIANHLYDLKFWQETQPQGYKWLISDQIGKWLDTSEILMNPIGAGMTALDNLVQTIPVSDSSKDWDISWTDRVKDFAINLIPSIGKLATSAWSAITNPADTMKAIWTLAFTEEWRNSFMDYLKSNYWSTQWFKDYMRKDPAGAISDIAWLVSWWATIAGKSAWVIGKLWNLGKVVDVAKVADTAWDVSKVSKLAKFQNTMSKVASVADTIWNAGIDIPIKWFTEKWLWVADNLIAGNSKIWKAAWYVAKWAINVATVKPLDKWIEYWSKAFSAGTNGIKSLNSMISPDIDTLIDKSIKPTVVWKTKNVWDIQKFRENAKWAVSSIIDNKDSLVFTDADWEKIYWQSPKTINEFSQSIEQTKQKIYNQYNELTKKAWWQWVMVDTNPIISELETLKDGMVWQIWTKSTRDYIDSQIKEIQDIWQMTPEKAQQNKQFLNNKLQSYYKSPDPNTIWHAMVDALVNNKLWKSLDDSIQVAIWDWTYRELKDKYAQLLNIEKDVTKRALVESRKNAKGLTDFSDIFSAGDVLAGIATGNPLVIAKGWLMYWLKEFYKNLNNVDANTAKLFKKMESNMETPSI